MFNQSENDLRRQGYREWNEQFNEINVPMPETGVFGWRRQQLSFNSIKDNNRPLPERGPNLLQRAFMVLRKALGMRIGVRSNPHSREAACTGTIAK